MSAWEKTKHHGKAGFDKLWAWADKLGQPVNRFTNKIGSEAFWPTTLDKESDKAARILKSFCKDGFYTEREEAAAQAEGPKQKAKVLVKIPQSVIQNAVGLAIFTTMRTGLWVSGSGGSGVLLARLPNGEWSPPSGILIHTLGVGWMAGIDIYDCVVVINNYKALEAFKKLRLSLGGEISVVAGPVGVGGIVDSNVDVRKKKDHDPVFTYMKSRGLYAGVQVDGTFILERTDENARFYEQPKISVTDILAGNIRYVPPSVRLLIEVVKAAEGRQDVDQKIVQDVMEQPAPADLEIEKNQEPTEAQKHAYAPPPGHAGEFGAGGPPPPTYSEKPPLPSDSGSASGGGSGYGSGFGSAGGLSTHQYPPPPPRPSSGGYAPAPASGSGAAGVPPPIPHETYPPPPGPPPRYG